MADSTDSHSEGKAKAARAKSEGTATKSKGEREVQSGETTNTGDTTNKAERITQAKLEPLAVTVETNLDKAMKILKRKLIKEGLFKELKARRYYEKPSEKKKRKMKETIKKLRKEEARARKNSLI